jgi:uncharacterized protein
MKYALIFGLVLVVFWLWRSSRNKMASPPPAPAQVAKSTEVVACAVCHVHLPRTEAVAGKQGLYCSAAHRQQADH